MKNARVFPKAREDLHEHAAYLNSKRHGYGRRFLLAFQSTVQLIERSPASIAFYGFRAPDIADVRVSTIKGFENWLVFFRLAEGDLQILRVLHGSRNIERLEGEILPE